MLLSDQVRTLSGWRGWALGALLMTLAGCGGAGTATRPEPGGHIQKVARLYELFTRTRGRPPAQPQEFRQFLQNLPANQRQALGLTAAVDELLTSPRDGQPYGFVWNQRPAAGPPPVVVYEQTGVDGKRLVADALAGGAVEVDEQEFRRRVPRAP
jgi:hypothetical protein